MNKQIKLAVVFLIGLSPMLSNASFLYDLELSPTSPGITTGTGSIEFITTSGSVPTDDINDLVAAFSLTGTGPLGGFSFTQPSEIFVLSFSIDPVTMALTLDSLITQGTSTGGVASCLGVASGVFSCAPNMQFVTAATPILAQQVTNNLSAVAIDLTATFVDPNQVPAAAPVLLLIAGWVGMLTHRRRTAAA